MFSLAALTVRRFRLALAAALGLAFIALQIAGGAGPAPGPGTPSLDDGRLHVFFHPDCPHCHDALAFLKTQPQIAYEAHDVSQGDNAALLRREAQRLGVADDELGVPLFVRGARYLLGFDNAETTGRDIIALAGEGQAAGAGGGAPRRIRLPLVGEIDPAAYSLAALAVVMGLADGFNPCAMWVLVYLISLILATQDRRKVWLLVGTFVLASGVLYFLFMTAWLKTFLLIGYIRPLTQFIALLAIGFGADHLFGLAASRGVVACEVVAPERRAGAMQWARDIVAAPVGLVSVVLIVGLAFTVNAVEFVCSAALPAIYTHILALTPLSAVAYYGYMTLYVLAFMLDDLAIFGFAAFAAQRIADARYAAFSRGVGGAVLIGLGAWMLAR